MDYKEEFAKGVERMIRAMPFFTLYELLNAAKKREGVYAAEILYDFYSGDREKKNKTPAKMILDMKAQLQHQLTSSVEFLKREIGKESPRGGYSKGVLGHRGKWINAYFNYEEWVKHNTIKYRLYVNLQIDKVLPFIREFIYRLFSGHIRCFACGRNARFYEETRKMACDACGYFNDIFYFLMKFQNPKKLEMEAPFRRDKIVMYFKNEESLWSVTGLVMELQQDHPEYFDNNLPPLVKRIKPGIGLGKEPGAVEVYEYNRALRQEEAQLSFGQHLCGILAANLAELAIIKKDLFNELIDIYVNNQGMFKVEFISKLLPLWLERSLEDPRLTQALEQIGEIKVEF